MRAFEARAIENIATAPATRYDRQAAIVVSAALLALFLVSIPFARVPIREIPAFIPTVVGASLLAMTLTTVLLFVQYRIERDLKLALLALAYGFSTVTQALYLLTFPNLFAPSGLLDAGPQSASCSYVASQLGFGVFVLAEGIAARRGWRLHRVSVRILTAVTAVVLLAFALLDTLGHAALPVVSHGGVYSWSFRTLVVPGTLLVSVVALPVAAGRLRTVTEIWISIVLVARIVSMVTGNEIAGTRFSLGWYAGRLEELIAAVVVLAVFLVKINDLMLRLAARSRSTAEALAFGEARYGALANLVPQLIWTCDPNGTIEYVNDRWIEYTGYDVAATREGGWRDAIDPDQLPAIRERWERSLHSGDPFLAEYRLREAHTGRYRWFLVNATPVRERRGTIVSWIGTCTDVDAQKRLEEREAFLARAGERLAASLDVTATVAAISTLLVPRLAERTWVALLDDAGRYVVAGVGSADIGDELDTRRWIGASLQPALHDAVARIVERGDPLVLEHPDRFPDPWLRELPAGAAMIVPLVSDDVAIGALALVRTSGRAYDLDDVGLVREFARRAALSLEHARLYERERTTADALQRAMLPAQLPRLADLRFSASYSAASESQRVGGDFYDAFELPDGRVAVTIGDVTGHGLEAAVVMGEIRQAIRAAAFESAEPSAILDRASRLLIASGRSLFVTAIFGVIDPVGGRFTYATAGHPPPILEYGGALQRLPSSGLPIGLRDEQGVDFSFRLHAPCTLVLYTDGLLEFGRDIAEGERRIEHAIRTLAHEPIEHLAAALMKGVLGDHEPTDDIAILTVTIDRFATVLPGDERGWRFMSDDARTGTQVRRQVGALVSAWTGRPEARFESELAFGELVANAVRHAPGPVHVVLSTDGAGSVTLVVEDSGAGFTLGERRLDPYAESGRGLALVDAVSDGLTIEPTPRGGARAIVRFEAEHALATPA